MLKHRVVNGFDSFEVFIVSVLIGVCIAMALVGIGASIAEASTHHVDAPIPHSVTQCPIVHGAANHCETFIIAGNPQPDELGEATATVRYLVVACPIYNGKIQAPCVQSVTQVGDQIIAPWHRHRLGNAHIVG